jgi:PAS domain S-box-containing protein
VALHSVLESQLRMIRAAPDVPPTAQQWRALLDCVDRTYGQAEEDRGLLERSVAASSSHMKALDAHVANERERLNSMVAAMGDGLCVLDAQGRIEMANPAAERLLDAQAGGLNGQDLGELVSGSWPPQQEKRAPLRELREAIRLSQAYRSGDARFCTLKRTWVAVSFVLTPIDATDPSGGSVLIFSDIRIRKAAEDAMRISEQRFRAIFELAAVGILRLDLAGRIGDCNRAFCEMLNDASENVVGRNLFARVHADEAGTARQRFEQLKRGDAGERQVERRYVKVDGSIVWAMEAFSFVRNEEGAPLFAIAVIENVTGRKQLESSLRQAQKLEAVGRLAAGIAHEINTPIQFIGDSVHFVRDAAAEIFGALASYRTLGETAADRIAGRVAELMGAESTAEIDYLAERIPQALDRALEGLDRVATIVRGMKEFAHPTQAEKAPADLNRAIETTLVIARNEYKYVADVDVELGELPLVTCLVGEFNQVLLNIIVNAAHAIAGVVQGTDAKGKIRIKSWRDELSVFVAVSDTGAGIPEAIRDQIFDPFFTTKEVGRGTGQGLAIARSVIVDKHRGELTFETLTGRGTTFTIRLPIQPGGSGVQAA